ncbi:MAG: beta-xylosidase [Verrucomicrobia bacterium]|nr:beta-xylosidase [Verrucomicrobiota bacterium]
MNPAAADVSPRALLPRVNSASLLRRLRIAWIAVGVGCGLPTLAAPSSGASARQRQGVPSAVALRVDASRPRGPWRPVWRYFGYDEPNYTYMPDGRKLLTELAEVCPRPAYVRTHNLLTSGDGTPALKWGSTGVYSEDPDGRPRYDWTILDRIFGTYVQRGLKPYVEIGFMPEALSTHPVPYQHHWAPDQHNPLSTGWAYPPKDYARWEELVYQWVSHCVANHGRAEVQSWYWEVWNEPNIFYWHGTPAEYHKLYDYAADGVKRALPTARIGGPEIAGTKSPGATRFLREFIVHCLRGTNYATGHIGAPLDFVSFHAKGDPRFIDGQVRMGIAAELQDVDRGFATVASFPELRHCPIVIGEWDPDGCAACPATLFPQYGYRNTPLYASYTAEVLARTLELADRHAVNLEGALTWAFEFENQPYFAGFRALASRGLDLPVFNLFAMLGRMSGQRVAVESSVDPGVEALGQQGVRATPDVNALASLERHRLCVLLWNYHDSDTPGPAAVVELSAHHLPARDGVARLVQYRIDRRHSDSFEAWRRMGSPALPTPAQYARLQKAGKLARLGAPRSIELRNGALTLRLRLPRQAVSLLVFEWPS